MAQETATYTHGHHESVLRSHSWRTAQNSAAYLLPHIQPNMTILDIGCGPGTITADFAALVPDGHVTGVEYEPDVLQQARDFATQRALTNITFSVGDIHNLPFSDGSFDIVHAHQVLQHVGDPVQALREMRRVAKKGGIVAARDADYSAMTWFPEVEGMDDWHKLYGTVARSNGGEPDGGRRLHMWARQVGFEPQAIARSASAWCYSQPEERAWWGGVWAERTLNSSFAKHALEKGHATRQDLDAIAKTWRKWADEEDGWFAVLSGEIICRV